MNPNTKAKDIINDINKINAETKKLGEIRKKMMGEF